MIGKELAYVALAVKDVEGSAAILTQTFGLPRADCPIGETSRSAPVFSVGASALALFALDDPFLAGSVTPGVHHLALAVTDLAKAARTAAAAGIPVVAGQDPEVGLGRRRRVLLAPDATVGVRTYLSEPLALDRASGGWVERIDHIGVASADNRQAIEVFSTRLGCVVESTQTDLEVQITLESFTSDKYGVVHHGRPPQPAGGLRVAFITVGDCELEFLQDFDPQQKAWVARDRPGTTKQDQGAIARFVAARGPGLHHVALKVGDIDAALAALRRAGLRVIDAVGRPGSRRALIGFVHPQSLSGVLLHLVQRDAP